MDKLQAIRFFVKLGDTLSFKGTAAYFGVPPSTVSRSIKSLERELGISLVERTTRHVRLTETGEWYRAEVTAPLRALAAADAMADVHSHEPAGTVRLTALPGYGEIRLFPVLERFRKAYPRIVCDVELTSRSLDLSTGDIDIALRATADPPDYLVAKRLHSNRFVLVASPGYLAKHGRPRLLVDIERHQALAYRGPNGVYPWLAILSSGEVVTVSRTLTLISNHGMLLLQAALAGDGIVFLPIWGAAEGLANGTLEEVALEDARMVAKTGAEMSVLALYHPEKARLGKVRAMVDFLVEDLGEA
jgi:DNA-binding transcriptional LysR family regulator